MDKEPAELVKWLIVGVVLTLMAGAAYLMITKAQNWVSPGF